MPLYDYDCSACGRRFEAIHGVYGDPPATCPLCGSGPVRKTISAPAFHFKGSGWAKKERRATPSPSGGSTTDGAEGGSTATDDAAAPAKGDDAAAPAKGDDASTSPSTTSTSSPSSTKTTD